MRTRLAARYLSRFVALLLVPGLFLTSMQALASVGLERQCPSRAPAADDEAGLLAPAYRLEIRELAAPKPAEDLLTEDELPKAAADAAQTTPAVATSRLVDELLEGDERAAATDSVQGQRSTTALPPTATRLPGVDDEDLPRFRRQMFRTDI